jgi:hypothetical protein
VTLVVEPINSPPEFEMESVRESFYEKLHSANEYTAELTVDHMFVRKIFFSITPGMFDEDEQQLRFGVKSVSNTGLVACVEVVCDELAVPGAGCQSQPGLDLPWTGAFGSCNGTAILRVWATPSRYGDEILEIILMDNGPLQPANQSPYGWLGAPRPDNNSSRLLTIHMIRFRFATSDVVFENSNFVNSVVVFENSNCVSAPPFNSLLSHADCNRSGVPFQHIRQGFVLDVPPPQQQNVTFNVIAHKPMRSPPTSATEIFSSRPSISADGTLSFALTPSAFGTTRFTVWLEDATKKTSYNVSFDIVVININNRPSANLPTRIVAFEDEPFQHIIGNRLSRDTSGNAVSDWEYDQRLKLLVKPLRGDMFTMAPSLKEIGTRFEANGVAVELSFRTHPLVFGTTSLHIFVQDDGGTAVGGENTLEKLILLEIVAINEAPTFELLESVFIFESSEPHEVNFFAFNMSTGPENERGLCDVFPGDCQRQKISFELDSVSNPNLFAELPTVSPGGTLSFRGCEYCSGATLFCLQAVDTGSSSASFPDCSACNRNLPTGVSCCFAGTESSRPVGTSKSKTKCARIHIEPIDHVPGFRLLWDVNCSTELLSNNTMCSCRAPESLVHNFVEGKFMGLDTAAGTVCTSKDPLDSESVVVVLEDAGLQKVSNFASSVSAAEGFSQPANSIFGGDDQAQRISTGQISFRRQLKDPLLSTHGLEFASHMQETGDGTLYFAEPETNSISMWARSGDSAAFQDRRTNAELRIRFRGLEDVDPMLMSVTGKRIHELQSVCSLQQKENSSDGSVLAGAGCELLADSDAFAKNDTFRLEPEWEHILGDWYFDSGAIYNMDGPMKVNKFSQHVDQNIDCSGYFCRYERPKLECRERFATSIGPASFRDRSNQMGAAVFVGNADINGGAKCKSVNSEFDTPADHTLSVVNLLGSVGEVEAIHFDGQVSSGLLVTDDINELVDGNPASSKLPLTEMTADIVFQLGTPDTTEHGLFSAMQFRNCPQPSTPADCGCQKGMRIAWRWTDSFQGILTLSMGIVLERTSKDIKQYPASYLKFTGTNVGPGVGVMQYFEWTSPPNYVWTGDWLHVGFTYDGRYARLFLNGSEMSTQHMCSSSCPPDEPECACGNIIYPAAYHTCPQYCECPTEECKRLKCPCGSNGPTGSPSSFHACRPSSREADSSAGGGLQNGEDTPVVIGTYIHALPRRFDGHIGLIHHIRIFKKALGLEYFQAQKAANAHILLQKTSASGRSSGSHFFQSNSQGNPDAPLCQPSLPPPSPSVSYVDVHLTNPHSFFKVHGLFSCMTSVSFKARFLYTYPFPSTRSVHLDTVSDCKVEESSCSGAPLQKFSDTLQCKLPSDRAWKHGYKAAVMAILESWSDGSEYYLVSKACFDMSCGWIAKSLRSAASAEMVSSSTKLPRSKWMVLSECCDMSECETNGQYLYSTAISGALSFFRFIVHSQLVTVSKDTDNVVLVSLFAHRKTSTTERAEIMSFGTFDNLQAPFLGYSSLHVLGVSSVRSFTMDNEIFLLVANYWDGKESRVLSPVFRVTDHAGGAGMQLTVLQGIPTSGARDMQFVRVNGVPFIIVANFEGDSEMFRWRGKGSISYVDVLDAGQGYVDGDVGLKCRAGPRGDECRRGNSLEYNPFLAKMVVDGKPDGGENRGKIVSVSVVRTFKTMTDIDVEIFYPGTREPMARTITSVWSSTTGWVFCPGIGSGRIWLNSTNGGFQASADVIDGRIHNVDIVDHGRGLDEVPDMVVKSKDGTACECLKSKAHADLSAAFRIPLSWKACIHVSIPQGSHRCVGGDQDGSTCSGVADELSCRGSSEVITAHGKVLNSGLCKEPRLHPVTGRSSAMLAIGPILDSPVRTRSRRLREEPAWREAPWISSQFPADISDEGKISLGKAANISGAASGVVTFERGPVTYCVISIYFDPKRRSKTRVDSKVLKMSIEVSSGDLLVDEVQRLPTNGAYGVSMLSMPFCRSVCGLKMRREVCTSTCDAQQTFVLIPCSVGTFSPLYLWNEGTRTFDLLQRVRTAKAVSAGTFQYLAPSGDWYVMVGQMDAPALVLRWNGTTLLGDNVLDTLPKDNAGGSNLGTMLTAGAFQKISRGDARPLLLAASYSNDASQLLTVRAEHLKALLKPVKLAVHHRTSHTADRIYVACHGTNSIGVFERQSFKTGAELYYRNALHIYSTQSAGNESGTGLSLHGINDLALQGRFLYTASSIAHGGGCIHVFEIASNGNLIEIPSMRRLAALNLGLRGVSAIVVGNRRLFAASKVDEAISAFARDEVSGALKYLDHVLNGERLLERYVTEVEFTPTSASAPLQSEMPGEPVAWYKKTFPFQFGHGLPWSDSAYFVRHCRVDGKELFVIVTGRSGAGSRQVLIYEWLEDMFIAHSELQNEVSTLHVEHFSKHEPDGVEWDFLVLSNAKGPSSVYRFNRDYNRFFFFNNLPIQLADGTVLPPHCADDGRVTCNSFQAYVLPGIKDPVPAWGPERPHPEFRKSHSFKIENAQFLAVAAWWPRSESGYTWFSYVYKWQTRGMTHVADTTTAKGVGFELFQVLPTDGAVDVRSAHVQAGPEDCNYTTLLLFVNHGLHDGHYRLHHGGSYVTVLQYSRSLRNAFTGDHGAFFEIQTLPGNGSAVIETFHAIDKNYIVIGAHFNRSVSNTHGVIENRTWGVFRWEDGRYKVHQDLSMFSTGKAYDGPALEVTSLKFFEWQNESYLAIGQGSCWPGVAHECLCTAPPGKSCGSSEQAPASIMLHWDKMRSMFGEMRAVLSTRYEHDKHYHNHHEHAMRLNAGAVTNIEFAAIDGIGFLLFASHNKGISCFEWDFEHIVGMRQVRGITVDPSETTTYAVYSGDSALVAVMLENSLDELSITPAVKLKYLKTWSQQPISMSRTSNTTWQHVKGIAGARAVSVTKAEGCNGMEACNVVVWAGPPLDEAICSSEPLYPVWEETLSSVFSTALPCQKVSFEIKELSSTNTNLFAIPPSISHDGTLSFLTAPTEYGESRLSVRIEDDGLYQGWIAAFDDQKITAVGPNGDAFTYKNIEAGQNRSQAQVFTIRVLPVNTQPRFNPVLIRLFQLMEGSEKTETVVFAHNVSTGSHNEIQQLNFTWSWALRFLAGWDARTAASDSTQAIVDVEEQKRTDVFVKCEEQVNTQRVFASPDRLYDMKRCLTECNLDPDCRYVIMENSFLPCSLAPKCTVVSSHPQLSGVFENPRGLVSISPGLRAEAETGLFTMSFDARLKGLLEMYVELSDDGENSRILRDGKGSVCLSETRTVVLTVQPVNQAPNFATPAFLNVTRRNSLDIVNREAGFVTEISAGFFECQCGQESPCGDIIASEKAPGRCQNITFSLFSVETLNNGTRPDYRAGFSASDMEMLFMDFHIDSLSGDLSFTTTPHWTGTYRVQIEAVDNGALVLGDSSFRGQNSTIKSFILDIPVENELPSFDRLDRLVRNETSIEGLVQRHAYFSNVSAGSGNTDLDMLFGVEFQIISMLCLNSRVTQTLALRNISCSAIFSQLPSFDAQGFVSFVLHPLANGHVYITVRPVNRGPEPAAGFQEVPAEIVIRDANAAPACSVVNEVVVLADSGPVLVPHFLVNWSAGNKEEWQNLIVQVTPLSAERSVFVGSEGPTVDSSGTLLFETARGVHGTVSLSVICLDDGGTQNGGSDMSPAKSTTLRILPRPVVDCVTPAIFPMTSNGSAVLTIVGRHFGSHASRGYFSADNSVYEDHIQVLLDGVRCRTTRYVSDTELLCLGIEAGQGVHDVQVRVADPFFLNRMQNNKSATVCSSAGLVNEGRLRGGVLRPLFLAGGVNFLAVGYHSLAPPPPPEPQPLFNGSEAPPALSNAFLARARSCELLVRSACINGSLLAQDLRWRDSSASFARNCSVQSSLPPGQLSKIFNILSPHLLWEAIFNSSKDHTVYLPTESNQIVICDASNCSCTSAGVPVTLSPWALDCGCACTASWRSSEQVDTTEQSLDLAADLSNYFAHFNGTGYFDANGLRVSPHNITRQSLIDIMNCSFYIAPPPIQSPSINASAPTSPASRSQPIVEISQVDIQLDGPVRALATAMGRVFVGGGFQRARGAGYKNPYVLNHVFEYSHVDCTGARGGGGIRTDGDGRGQQSRRGTGYLTPHLESLGGGTDGSVYAMAYYQNLIVVGGSFQHVYPSRDDPLLGALAAWNPEAAEWSLIGRTPLRDATVLEVKVNRNALYVAGRFRIVGGVDVKNIAVHRGAAASAGGWSGMSTGLHGGHAVCMAFVGNEVIVGGDFVKAGETLVNNIARWDGSQWQRMADKDCAKQCELADGPDRFLCQKHNCELDGMVTVLASHGAAVYAAGLFRQAGARPALGLAQYFGSPFFSVAFFVDYLSPAFASSMSR